ncbi:MAG: GNAT family N-acetyltransferase [Actinomycetes bacterium]
MTAEHAPALMAALDDDRVWAGGFGGGPEGRPRDVEGMRDVVSRALRARAAGTRVPYVVRLLDDEVVGTTSLGDWSLPDERVHLGWTAYGPAWWGTVVNAECKLLLLGHAFRDCGFGRVKIQTDAVNARSQAAIERLGAVREGVLRRHQRRADGSFRDTVVYSILSDEWPDVERRLQDRLLQHMSATKASSPPPDRA